MTQTDRDQLVNLLQDNEDEDTRRLSDVLQLIFMSSRSIADVVAANFEGPLRPTTPIWFPLLRTRTAYQGSHATPVPFVAPQGFDTANGLASMLLSCVADYQALFYDPDVAVQHLRNESGSSKSDKASLHVSTRDDKIEERNTANNWGYVQPYTGPPDDHPIYTAGFDDVESESGYASIVRLWYPSTDSASDKSVESVEMLPEDLPLDAHILAHRGEWLHVMLPAHLVQSMIL